MLASMTAFAKIDFSSLAGTFCWEIRCVNHRYFEPRFHLPDQFALFESSLRDLLKDQLTRGRCDINLRFLPQANAEPLKINHQYAEALLSQLTSINKSASLPMQVNAFELLLWPGVLQQSAQVNDQLQTFLLKSFKEVLQRLVADRQREGHELQQIFLQRLKIINEHLEHIRQRVPQLLPLLHERLKSYFQQLNVEMNQDRLEQEIVYLAHKMDVQEEQDRFETHFNEFRKVIEKGGAVGRRLDFLLQELQREINTLENKANDRIISLHVVEIKVLIEQVREQVQNVE